MTFFDLGAAIDGALAAELAEIDAIRNCLMHRRGIIDERAVREAPSIAARLNFKHPASGSRNGTLQANRKRQLISLSAQSNNAISCKR